MRGSLTHPRTSIRSHVRIPPEPRSSLILPRVGSASVCGSLFTLPLECPTQGTEGVAHAARGAWYAMARWCDGRALSRLGGQALLPHCRYALGSDPSAS